VKNRKRLLKYAGGAAIALIALDLIAMGITAVVASGALSR